MQLAAEGWRLREEARKAIVAGDAGRGVELAAAAQGVHATPEGEALRMMCRWLGTAM